MGVVDLTTKTIRETKFEDPYKTLAYAVIKKALDDYREALSYAQHQLTHGYTLHVQTFWRIKECEDFFKSEYFMLLSPVPGDLLIDTVTNERDYREAIKWRNKLYRKLFDEEQGDADA